MNCYLLAAIAAATWATCLIKLLSCSAHLVRTFVTVDGLGRNYGQLSERDKNYSSAMRVEVQLNQFQYQDVNCVVLL